MRRMWGVLPLEIRFAFSLWEEVGKGWGVRVGFVIQIEEYHVARKRRSILWKRVK